MSALGLGAQSDPTAGFDMTFGFDMSNILAPPKMYAEGGDLADEQIKGPGTGTSDSILAWVDNVKKFIRVSDGEWIMKQKAVEYYGPNIMNALNRGMIPRKVFEVHAKYAKGGSLRGMMPTTGMNGAYGLSAEMSGNFNPNVYVTNRIDGNGILNSMGKMIDSQVDKKVEKSMIEKAKLNSMLMKRIW